jgi:hypothetical protein
MLILRVIFKDQISLAKAIAAPSCILQYKELVENCPKGSRDQDTLSGSKEVE